MKISRKWLEEYAKTDLSDIELADKLTMTGTAIESVIKGLNGKVVVARIEKVERHPNADRLQLATVTDGKKTLTVVCGAPNIAVGQKVPLAKIGAALPEFEIKKTSIRGIESCGMLCAQDELALGEDHSGIMILPDEYEIGKPLSEYINKDTLFDVEITPNRGDCLSHFGVAREIAVFSNKKAIKEPIALNMSNVNASSILKVSISDEKLCQQYMARVIKGVKIGPSPKWLADKITAMGSKPINNIVDITNYILYDLGQPLHAFDLDKIARKEIVVRKASESEAIRTLDGVERKLNKDTLVIADGKNPIAIAGIMGGANSEVDSKTVNLVIEAAEFDRISVRKSCKKLSLSSEASYRFERGIDSGGVEYALNKATKLIAECGGGIILNGIVRAGKRPENLKIAIEYKKINALLGLELPEAEINHILNKLGFEIENSTAIVPLWRKDITFWQDLAEEIGRIHGYENITPIPVPKTKLIKRSDYYKKERIKDLLVSLGFVEVYNYPYLSEADIQAAKLSTADLLEVANPIQAENKYLRKSLIPTLLKNIAKNPTFDPVLLFEIGKVFSKKAETTSLSIVASGKNADKHIEEVIDHLASLLKVKKDLIKVSELSRDELQRFKIKKPITFVFEIQLEGILPKLKLGENELKLKVERKEFHYRPISKCPSVTRDLAFIVNRSVNADTIRNGIFQVSRSINRVELFDEFTSDKFGKGNKNVAYHLYLEEMDRTMTDREADRIIKNVVKEIENNFNAKLRAE